MDVDGIKKLIGLMNENDLCELEVEEDGRKVRLRKHERHPPANGLVMPMREAPAAPRKDLVEIRSPLVGTFYRSPKPGSPTYCEINDRVTPDKTLCIIEAMKVMNEIKAEVEGVIDQILVNNGEPVEFNQVMFLLRKE
jgi:acetyl-CoA carboxylase biotin carboxyl carrier protein